jgi:hypothetical protein
MLIGITVSSTQVPELAGLECDNHCFSSLSLNVLKYIVQNIVELVVVIGICKYAEVVLILSCTEGNKEISEVYRQQKEWSTVPL